MTTLGLDRNNSLEEIDLSALVKLTTFSCSSCNLNSLDISNNELLENLDVGVLAYLGCPEDNEYGYCTNHIPSIDFSNNNRLQRVNLNGNKQIENIDVYNLQLLEELSIQNAALISSLDISNNINLTSLNIGGTLIEDIGLSNQPRLLRFNGTRSLLRSLDISHNLEIGSFIISQAPNLDCIKVAPFHLNNQLYNETINGSTTYDGGYEISVSYDDDVQVGLSCSPFCTSSDSTEVENLISEFRNYTLGDTYDFGTGEFSVTASYGGSTPQGGVLEGITYESVRFSSNSDDTNSIWIEFNFREDTGEFLFSYVGRRDTSETGLWSYVRTYYAPDYQPDTNSSDQLYYDNLCDHWVSLISHLSTIPNVE